jgi:phosphatidylglycerophosphate synthase
MKISLSTILNAVCIMIGSAIGGDYLWIPILGLTASVITSYTKEWATSDKLGRNVRFGIFLKFAISLIGLIAIISQVVAIGLIVYWLFA